MRLGSRYTTLHRSSSRHLVKHPLSVKGEDGRNDDLAEKYTLLGIYSEIDICGGLPVHMPLMVNTLSCLGFGN